MVGGGEGAFIGAVHRMAAALDGEIELVCGAFSSDADRAQRSGAALYLPPERVYGDYRTMMAAEAALPAAQRMQFVAIVTPNHLHFPVAEAALRSGFHVLSDKPATLNLHEALRLRDILAETGLLYGLTHTYTGYPLVKEARARVAAGELGKVRKIVVEYPQGWLADRAGRQQTTNRPRGGSTRRAAAPAVAWATSGCTPPTWRNMSADCSITALCSDLDSVCAGPRRWTTTARSCCASTTARAACCSASQVSVGEENALSIRVYGERGGLEWRQQEPNTLWLKWPDRPTEMLRTGGAYLGALAAANTRTPMGHPEGYLEAFANIYMAFAGQIRAREAGRAPAARAADCPGIDEAIRGMAFIELAVAASASDTKWHAFEQY